jgi:hypothetical protein
LQVEHGKAAFASRAPIDMDPIRIAAATGRNVVIFMIVLSLRSLIGAIPANTLRAGKYVIAFTRQKFGR